MPLSAPPDHAAIGSTLPMSGRSRRKMLLVACVQHQPEEPVQGGDQNDDAY
jgi:hypothetical protein